MKRRLLLLPLLFFLANMPLSQAQYDDIRFPRSENEINRIKNLKIKKEAENSTETGQELPNAMNNFDANGRIIRSISPEARRIFSYNLQGQLVSRTDSLLEGRRFKVEAYSFEYDEQGKLSAAKLPGGSSVFSRGPADNIISEIYTGADGKKSYRTYKYNETGRLKEESWKNADSSLQKTRRIYLNKRNMPVAEVIIANNYGKLDSTYIMRVFDANDDIVKKQLVVVSDYKNTATAKKESKTFIYTYDPKGNMTSESCNATSASACFKNEWSYTGAGYPNGRINYDGGGKVARRFTYRYDLWSK